MDTRPPIKKIPIVASLSFTSVSMVLNLSLSIMLNPNPNMRLQQMNQSESREVQDSSTFNANIFQRLESTIHSKNTTEI